MDAQMRSETQTLSLKRKRPPCSGVVQVSGGVLDYWAAALGSEYASILKLMITQSRALANQASVETLTGQAPPGFNSERNALLVDISTRNAVKSAEALSGAGGHDARARAQDRDVALPQRRGPATHAHGPRALVVRRVQHHRPRRAHAPARCRRRAATPRWSGRSPCATRRRTTRPPASCPAWSRDRAPGRGRLRQAPAAQQRHYDGARGEAIKQRRSARVRRRAGRDAHGRRARLHRACAPRLVVGESQLRAGRAIAEACARARGRARSRARHAWSATSRRRRSRPRPRSAWRPSRHATPSNNLALALEANEQLRMLFKSKSHRGDPCRHLCGVAYGHRAGRGRVRGARPPADAAAHRRLQGGLLDDPDVPLHAVAAPPRRRARDRCHHAHRVRRRARAPARAARPLCARAARGRRSDAPSRSSRSSAAARRARASSTTSPAPSRPGTSTRSIASAKRILVGDLNLRLFCTLFQVYRVGTSNVPRSYETTPWSGCYGATKQSNHVHTTRIHTPLTIRRCGLRHRHLGRHRHPRLVGNG